jgi:FkbM family methyltransferase
MTGAVGQLVMDRLLASTRRSPTGLVRRGYAGARRALLLAADPVITADVAGHVLRLPLSHELPVYQATHPGYSMNLAAVAAVVIADHPDGCIVDIGANVGDSVAIIRTATTAPILCIEGDETFLPLLRENLGSLGPAVVEPCYVASTRDTGAHRVERVGGTARLVAAADCGPALVEVPLAQILDRHRDLGQPALVKIDTDGHDANIIADAIDVLEQHRAVLFFEWDPRLMADAGGLDATAIFPLLQAHGYEGLVLFANTGEMLCQARSDDAPLLADLARFVLEPGPISYFDICAVHEDDAHVAAQVVEAVRSRASDRRLRAPT